MKTADAALPTNPACKKVTVILSTFNFSAYIEQQRNSLDDQTHPETRIIVRDDGSSDATPKILEQAHSAGRIELLRGNNNLGAAQSFFELLKYAVKSDPDYVALCDQDDVWQSGKISCALTALSAVGGDQVAMYASRAEIVDKDLTHIGYTRVPERVGFGNALLENVCVGCTIVLNRKAIELICRNLPTQVPVHDWWCYLVVACFGKVVFDQNAYIKYRQHGENVFGVPKNTVDRLMRGMSRFAGKSGGRNWQSEQARVFLACFEDQIPLSNRRTLSAFVQAKSSSWRRLRLAFSPGIWRQKRLDSIAMRLLILINRY